ncbi:hypothetical protein [Caballeronia sp. INDeC2]|uniref:hypothetical protein n=1 Tax=Caballeronia sp. INDeC2 TaxID=2921747 RepID=UPI0020282016|nr:hypothetical protein [Caballeronia sp. INDeC2]
MQSTSTKQGQRNIARVVSAINLVALLAASADCAAQPQPPVAPPPPVAAAGLPPPLADDGTRVTTQATVSRFLINPDGDVDGFLTGDGALVHFPPHMSAQLTSAIHPGDSVQIDGWRDAGGNLEAQRITDAKSGRQLADQPPLPGTQPLPRELRGAGLSRLSAQGRVAHITTGPRGEPDGVILADGTVIKLTPPVAQQFPALVQAGARVSAQGYGTRNRYGTALQATSFGAPGNLTRLYDRVAPSP